jgi:hypothetical protein
MIVTITGEYTYNPRNDELGFTCSACEVWWDTEEEIDPDIDLGPDELQIVTAAGRAREVRQLLKIHKLISKDRVKDSILAVVELDCKLLEKEDGRSKSFYHSYERVIKLISISTRVSGVTFKVNSQPNVQVGMANVRV